MSQFTKPAITPEDQLNLLVQRGLKIQNQERSLSFIRAVSFFRLTPYMRPFQQDDDSHAFKEGTGFKQLSELYGFDRRLRLLVMDAVERTEVAVRAHISNHMGVKYGAHWYLERHHFKDAYRHADLLKEIQKKQSDALRDYQRECQRIDRLKGSTQEHKDQLKLSRTKESYARHYGLTYTEPDLMPNWAMVEELTLGGLSHLYKGLARDSDRKSIANDFNLAAPLLESWLHTITAVRNICAHHGRLWNRELGIKPATPKSQQFNWPQYLKHAGAEPMHTRVAVVLSILQHFMNQCAPHASWKQRLIDLLNEYPNIPFRSMGLPENWQQDPFWQ